jgi:hypothetical protein
MISVPPLLRMKPNLFADLVSFAPEEPADHPRCGRAAAWDAAHPLAAESAKADFV